MGSLVVFLGFRTLACGCVVGRYHDLSARRELSYVEAKGTTCGTAGHRRNQTLPRPLRRQPARPPVLAARGIA